MIDGTLQPQRLAILAVLWLVHAGNPTTALLLSAKAATPMDATRPSAAATAPKASAEPLPPAVVGMRDAILEAVQSGRLEDLKIAVDLNELKPELAAAAVPDPIAYWRRISADGQGRDILATVGVLFDGPYAVEPLGKDLENTRLFVWPAFADQPLASLTTEDDAHLIRLEGTARATAMKGAGRYTGWRVVIGADGVWHAFRRYD